jgi:hypothetical protein
MNADVRSIDALREWHAALATYSAGLADALAGVDMEIRRAHDWLGEQLSRWQNAVRECEEEVVQAKAELSARKFPGWDGREPDTTVQEKAVRKAKAKKEHAEDQVALVRSWMARLPKLVDEAYTGPSRRLGNMLEADLPKALAALVRQVGALDSYAGVRPDFAPGPSLSAPAPPGPTSPPKPATPETPT